MKKVVLEEQEIDMSKIYDNKITELTVHADNIDVCRVYTFRNEDGEILKLGKGKSFFSFFDINKTVSIRGVYGSIEESVKSITNSGYDVYESSTLLEAIEFYNKKDKI